jgi:carbon-monoxide dehydrogenase catalytic subunit
VKLVIDHIEKKRDALGINVKKERKLYDMEDRRALAVEGSEAQAGCEPGIAHSHRKKD